MALANDFPGDSCARRYCVDAVHYSIIVGVGTQHTQAQRNAQQAALRVSFGSSLRLIPPAAVLFER